MTAAPSTQTPRPTRSARRRTDAASRPHRSRPRHVREERRERRRPRTLGRYVDDYGRRREVVARRGAAGSVLVLDRDSETLDDRRLVAHLGADEPEENARIVCRRYLEDSPPPHGCCRRFVPEDLRTVPFDAEEAATDWPAAQHDCGSELVDRDRCAYRLDLVQTRMSIPELRWTRRPPDGTAPGTVSLRDVIAALERYEPVRGLSRGAVALHAEDPTVSVTVLRAELERVLTSPIVLNRGLRHAVLAAIEREQLSMSEIAIRCGRMKRDSNGRESGETSWLARRLGILPEGGHEAPTRWIHSDVLALISRSGLGISPREVEL